MAAEPQHYDRSMALPLKPPIQPQLALSRKTIPEGEGWIYEPKFDGFRVIAFVDGEDVYLQSRGAKPLRRYFPELDFPPGRYVLDGELLILGADGHEQFDALQNRLHPAESRVEDARRADAGSPARLRPPGRGTGEAPRPVPSATGASDSRRCVAGLGGRKKAAAGSIELTPMERTLAKAAPWLEAARA